MSESSSLSLAIALPSMDIQALIQGVTLAALPNRSLRPGQCFLLYPVETESSAQAYHPQLTITQPPNPPSSSQVWIEAWAKCERCELIGEASEVEDLAHYTIWTAPELIKRKQNRAYLFLAYLKVYQFTEKIAVEAIANITEKIGKPIAMGQSINIDPSTPILSPEEFNQQFQNLQSRQPTHHPEPQPPPQPVIEPSPIPPIIDPPIPPVPDPPIPPVIGPDDDQWIEQIATIGNSSQGHDFERLIRKALIFLGFENTINHSKASLDPDATGGPGGLDFYANQPYPIVGECKATKTEKVSDGTPAQLIRLGHNILQEQYNPCVKIIIAAGELTEYANKTALSNDLNVIRPETIQNLTQLKKHYPGSINLWALKECLEREPFGEQADQKLRTYIAQVIQALQIRSDLVQLVKEEGGSVEFLRGGFRRNYTLQDREMYQILIELSSPLTGYIGRKKNDKKDNKSNKEDDGLKTDSFYFLRDFVFTKDFLIDDHQE
ncbi:DUF1802 family protein [Spirulina sp. CCNP1310]|uniref:DUF1802 family protein n=1 Tax=Spirulina sp. CCNP1310 TaxID=3110249 RepID=UPI002B1EA2FC|nr:DUF1802 family protein [Spirulina sp. CCNP1310]MEA5418277.1 DUF1802 family protein [Spirulina sp. CCNP1310]